MLLGTLSIDVLRIVIYIIYRRFEEETDISQN